MEIQVPMIYAGVNGLVRVPVIFQQTFRLIPVVVGLYSCRQDHEVGGCIPRTLDIDSSQVA
jgi:hypothetical protein